MQHWHAQTGNAPVNMEIMLLGVDGGGTRCRARLAALSGEVLGEADSGPANLRLGLAQSFSAVFRAATLCLDQAGLSHEDLTRIVACLALAGASEPSHRAAAEAYKHPFRDAIVTTDAHAACIGAHGPNDGGVIICGTGTVGWAVLRGQTYRVGGWGLPISDEGSGAWLGCEALRRVLWARDGRIGWTPLLRALFAHFGNDPHAIVRWTQSATPRDYGAFVPRIAEYSEKGDAVANELMIKAADQIEALAERLIAAGAPRLVLVGGCAGFLRPRLSEKTKCCLVEPHGDALEGALQLARAAVRPQAQVA